MAGAGQASAFLYEGDFLEALDGVADLVPARRSAQAHRPGQHLQAWIAYAERLEARLQQVHEQLAAERTDRLVHRICCREPEASAPLVIPAQAGIQGARAARQREPWIPASAGMTGPRAAPRHDPKRGEHPDQDQGERDRLELLARVRAEQLMSLRLLNLLARCASLDMLHDPHGEAAAVLDGPRRRELRLRDLQDSRAEHEALRQAQRAETLRTRDGEGAKRLAVPGLRADLN